MRVYFDFNDWWIGYYRGPNHHYICPLPTVVIRWERGLNCPHFWRRGAWSESGKCDICRYRAGDDS